VTRTVLQRRVAKAASSAPRGGSKQLDLHHLRYVLVTAEEGSFHRAAARLRIAPSALSRRIQDAEAELDLALFERCGGGVKLSYAGREFLPYAQRIFAEMAATAAHFRRRGRGQNNVLRIAMNDIAPQLPLVPALFRAFREQIPGTELRLLSLRSDDQLRALHEEQIDAGILYTRPEDDAGFDFLRLASHRFVLAMPAGHRLATASRLNLADLAAEDFVLFAARSGPVIHGALMENCAQSGLAPRIVQETFTEQMQLGLVAAGMGLSFVDESATLRQNRPDLVFKPVEDLLVRQHLDLTWRRDRQPACLTSLIALATNYTAADTA
jgi:DNA-binding transcriptional LysR family regulator